MTVATRRPGRRSPSATSRAASSVYVLSGKTVYEFDWGNSTFNAGQHLEEIDFLHVLKGVVFPASDAAVPGASTAPSTR